MKMIHHGEKGFTLIELLIVVAILGIIAAVIIPNIGTFMNMGTLSAANSEAENVKTASLAYYADVQAWPEDTTSASGNYSFADYVAGTLKADYYFNTSGFITGVSTKETLGPFPVTGQLTHTMVSAGRTQTHQPSVMDSG
jgi:type IV pilus assembly protein PilA